MSNYFLDSSALLKRYVSETGSGWIGNLTPAQAGNTLIVAQITQAETVSAVSRQKREHHISSRTARAIRLLIDRHFVRQYLVVNLSSSIIQLAENLLEAHPLRAYDSIQLASAIELNDRLKQVGSPALIFLSADKRLLAVAGSVGLITDNPENYP